MKENNGNELKQQIIEKVAEQVKDEDLLKLNEMEEVDGGVCGLGCVAACFWGGLKAVSVEENEGLQP